MKIPKFSWPVFFGHYPDEMRTMVDQKSNEEGLDSSRLPQFDRYWETQVKGSWDFLGRFLFQRVLNFNPINDVKLCA